MHFDANLTLLRFLFYPDSAGGWCGGCCCYCCTTDETAVAQTNSPHHHSEEGGGRCSKIHQQSQHYSRLSCNRNVIFCIKI